MNYSVSLIAPAHNEEANVSLFLEKATSNLEKITNDYEIIIVNDGSTDGTRGLIDDFSQKNKKVKCVDHKINLGYGKSLRSGFQKAKKDIIFFTDSDNQFDLSEMNNFLQRMSDNTVVVGYRKNRKDNIFRKLNGRVWTKFINIIYRLKVKDLNCAFKMFKRSAVVGINLRSSGALINAELLRKFKLRGYKFVEMPVKHYPRKKGKQSGAKLSVILKALKETLGLYERK